MTISETTRASLARFAHLRPRPSEAAEANTFARNMLRTAAIARGDKFDPAALVQGPDQSRTRVTGDDLVRVLKQSGRAAKQGEGH